MKIKKGSEVDTFLRKMFSDEKFMRPIIDEAFKSVSNALNTASKGANIPDSELYSLTVEKLGKDYTFENIPKAMSEDWVMNEFDSLTVEFVHQTIHGEDKD